MESPDGLVIDRSHRSPPSSHIRVGLETSAAGSGAIVLYRTESEKEVIPRKGKYFTLPKKAAETATSPFSVHISTATARRSLSEAAHTSFVTGPAAEQSVSGTIPHLNESPQTYRLTSPVSGHSILTQRFRLADCLINHASRAVLTRLMLQSPPPERQQHVQCFHKTLNRLIRRPRDGRAKAHYRSDT